MPINKLDVEVTGDLSAEEVFSGGLTETSTLGVSPSRLELEKQDKELDLKRQESSGIQYMSAMADNALKDNILHTMLQGLGNKVESAKFFDQDGYKVTSEMAIDVLEANQLDFKYADQLMGVGSPAEFTHFLKQAKREVDIDKNIYENLDSTDRITSSIAGTVFDVDMMLGLGVGAMYSKSASLAKILTMEAGAEAMISTGHYIFDKDYTVEDGIIDAGIGIGIAYGFTKMYKALDTNPESVRAKTDLISTEANKDHADIIGDLRTQPTEVVRDVDGNIKFTKEDAVTDRVVTGTTREQQVIRDEFTKAFDSPKYDDVKLNRDSFFRKQDEIVNKRIDSVPAREDIAIKNISDTEARLLKEQQALTKADTTRKKTLRQNKIQKLEDEVASHKQALDDYRNGTVGGVSREDIRFKEMVDDIARNMKDTYDDIEFNVKNNNAEWINDNKKIVEELTKRYPDELTDLNNLMKSKLGNSKDFVKKPLKIGKKILSRKQKAALVALGFFGASALSADDGSTENIGIGLLVVASMVIGMPRILETVKSPKLRRQIAIKAKHAKDVMTKAEVITDPDTKQMLNRREVLANNIKTRLTSTIAPFEKAGGEINALAQKLLYSAKNGFGVEYIKQQRIEASNARYIKQEKYYIRQYKKEVEGTETTNIYSDLSHENQFRHQVADYMEGDRSGTFPDSVKEFSKVVDEEFDQMFKYNVENETFGFVSSKNKDGSMSKDKKYVKGMIPRLWKNDIGDFINRFEGAEDIKNVTSALSQAIFRGGKAKTLDQATKQAESFVERWSDTSVIATRKQDLTGSNFDSISHLMKDETEIEDYLNALNVKGDEINRAKSRIDMDMDIFQEELSKFSVTIDGIDSVSLNKGHFVDRNIRSIFDKTSTQMYTSGALSSVGIKSVKELDGLIESASKTTKDKKLLQDMEDIRGLVLNQMRSDGSDLVTNVSLIVKDMVLAVKLPLSLLATTPEVMNMVATHGIGRTLSSFSELVNTSFGKESELMYQLTEAYGIGTSARRHDLSFYGLSDDLLALEDNGVTNMVRKGTMRFRDLSTLPLGAMTDVIQRMSATMNAEALAKKLMGQDVKNVRWESVSIKGNPIMDGDLADVFKGDFVLNENGRLQKVDMSKWSAKKKDLYGAILKEMGEQQSLTSSIGETPLFSKTDSLGRIMTVLMSYGMSQFNNHTVEGVRNMDRVSAMHMMTSFFGTYMGMSARYAIQDKEMDNEQLLLYSMLSTPALAPIGIVKGFGDPVVFNEVSAVTSIPANIIGSVINE